MTRPHISAARTLRWASVAGVLPIVGVPDPITANGNTDPFDISDVQRLMASVETGTPTGTSPTLNLYLDVLDPIGNWLAVISFVQLTAASYTYAPVGPGTANTYVLTDRARFRWVVGGTDPSFPAVAVSAVGHR